MQIEDILTSDNLVPELDDEVLRSIHKQIDDQYHADTASMADYFLRYENALKLARMDSSKVETKLKNGAKVMMPFIMEAAIDFNARVVMEYLSRSELVSVEAHGMPADPNAPDAQGIVKTKQDRASRATKYANYVLGPKEMKWRRITDKEMMALPIVGTTYKKTWYDPVKGRMCSGLIMADEVVFSQEVECFEDAPQVAHKLTIGRNYMISMKRAGLWEFDEDKLVEGQDDFEFIEVQFCYDIDDDGYDEPYIAMVSKDLQAVVRIVANFEPEDIRYNIDGEVLHIKKTNYITQKQLIPDPEGRPMGLGFGILLHDIFHTINTNTRQLIDAGTLHNLAGSTGLIASGVQPRGNQAQRMQTGEVQMEMGVFKQVQVSGAASLRESIAQPPFAGPSATLFQLLQHMEESARRMTVAGLQVQANANEAASLYLARLQQALKAPNAMIWRVAEGFQQEFYVLFNLLSRSGDDQKYQLVIDQPASLADDFNMDDCDITPTLNPSEGSDYERMARAQMTLETANQSPQMHNMYEAYRRYYEASGVVNVDSILPPPDPNAVDPMQQLQMQYMAMEAEFRNRDMAVKEQKLAIEQMKAVSEMRAQMVKLQSEIETASAERVKTLTEAIENLAKVADFEEQKALRTISFMTQGAADGRELSATQPGRDTSMAGTAGNQVVSSMPGMV